jgi:hypothetical protein
MIHANPFLVTIERGRAGQWLSLRFVSAGTFGAGVLMRSNTHAPSNHSAHTPTICGRGVRRLPASDLRKSYIGASWATRYGRPLLLRNKDDVDDLFRVDLLRHESWLRHAQSVYP